MKIVSTRENNSLIVGSSDKHVMTDAEGASLFYLLSESLYSRPEESSVREIVTNAFDAHLAAGHQKPVMITVSEELITIQDSGLN